jgi:hypothetical protein
MKHILQSSVTVYGSRRTLTVPALEEAALKLVVAARSKVRPLLLLVVSLTPKRLTPLLLTAALAGAAPLRLSLASSGSKRR